MFHGTHQIERFFRVGAGLDVDKDDIKRNYEFLDQTVIDLLLVADTQRKRMTGSGLSRATFRSPKDCRKTFMLSEPSISISDWRAF